LSFHPQVFARPRTPATEGFLLFFRFTPELWSYALPHRTQILYFYDISTVVLQLNLKPGSIVVESGTGSGSLTNALARAVAPLGHVHTFEFNGERARKAKEEFAELGIDSCVTVKHADACSDGFGRHLDNRADGVFLDLPCPWLAIPHAYAALKPANGIICCFSPCIEQVQRSCLKLATIGFEDVRTVEALGREFDVLVSSIPQPPIPSLFAGAAAAAGSGASAVATAAADAGAAGPAAKRKRTEFESEGAGRVVNADGSITLPAYPTWGAGPLPLAVRQHGEGAPGHSGYLTFATLYRKKLSNEEVLAGKALVDERIANDLINRAGVGAGAGAGASDSSSANAEGDVGAGGTDAERLP